MSKEVITLGGGCFWCLEAVYNELQGIESAISGYAGGHVVNPTYEQVCNKTTGHAEVVQVTFDNAVIRLEEVLNVFFAIHDPTTLNRQGNDVGPQYRSAIFYHNEAQKETAKAVIAELTDEGLWNDPVVTEITAFDTFYRAEDYHQNYFKNNPTAGYCAFVVAPKVAKFRKQFFDKLKKQEA